METLFIDDHGGEKRSLLHESDSKQANLAPLQILENSTLERVDTIAFSVIVLDLLLWNPPLYHPNLESDRDVIDFMDFHDTE